MSLKHHIESVACWEVLDSRGRPTVASALIMNHGQRFEGMAPSGASVGRLEAVEKRDGEPHRYRGKGVQQVCAQAETVFTAALRGYQITTQAAFDQRLIEMDGTSNKQRYGANVLLSLSLAYSKMLASEQGLPLYRHWAEGQSLSTLPIPMVNVINGGAHAENNLHIQEFMIVPHGFRSFQDALVATDAVFHQLGQALKEKGWGTALGDEGGYAPNVPTASDAFDLICASIHHAGYQPGQHISLALDCASSAFYDGESAYLDHDTHQPCSREAWLGQLKEWVEKYPIISLEDAMAEDDWKGWRLLTEAFSKKLMLVGDDLFVTNPVQLEKGVNQKVANSILIKLNQIGTVSECIAVMKRAQEAGYRLVVSHRSGETEDTSIADLAVAFGAPFIKTGCLRHAERNAKYNRLLSIAHASKPPLSLPDVDAFNTYITELG